MGLVVPVLAGAVCVDLCVDPRPTRHWTRHVRQLGKVRGGAVLQLGRTGPEEGWGCGWGQGPTGKGCVTPLDRSWITKIQEEINDVTFFFYIFILHIPLYMHWKINVTIHNRCFSMALILHALFTTFSHSKLILQDPHHELVRLLSRQTHASPVSLASHTRWPNTAELLLWKSYAYCICLHCRLNSCLEIVQITQQPFGTRQCRNISLDNARQFQKPIPTNSIHDPKNPQTSKDKRKAQFCHASLNVRPTSRTQACPLSPTCVRRRMNNLIMSNQYTSKVSPNWLHYGSVRSLKRAMHFLMKRTSTMDMGKVLHGLQ